MTTNPDYRDLFSALCAEGADFIVVGAHQIGIAPNRIDVLTSVDALDFDGAWERRVQTTYGGVPISVLGLEDLIANKRAVNRLQDQLDLQRLEAARRG